MACPDQAILGQNLTCTIQAKNTSGSPVDTDALPTFSVYEDETSTAILTGTMSKLDDDNTTGFYSEQLTITAANGFELWKSYTIRYSAEIGGTALSHQDTFNIVQTALAATTTSGALTTVANFKTYTGVTTSDDDALITALIARATSAIQAYCGRTLISATYREFYDGWADRELWLNQTPVTSIQLLATGRTDIISLTMSDDTAYNAHATVNASNLTLRKNFGGPSSDVAGVVPLSTNTLTSLVAVVNALGTGWTATLLLSDFGVWGADELLPASGLQCYSPTISNLELPADVKSDFIFDGESGRVTLNSGFVTGKQGITIRYTAGYSTTPADLEQITIDVVNTYYLSRQRDTTVMEEALGDHKIKYADRGGGSVSYRNIPQSLQMRLGPWKRYKIPFV